MSKKTIFFLSVLIIGLATFIITVFVFSLDGTLGLSLTIAGTLCILGGIVGCYITADTFRAVIRVIIDILFQNY